MTDELVEQVARAICDEGGYTDYEGAGKPLYDSLARAVIPIIAAHERARIAEWLRHDADLNDIEARAINKNTIGNPRKIAAEWATMTGMKRGIAAAIEKGI